MRASEPGWRGAVLVHESFLRIGVAPLLMALGVMGAVIAQVGVGGATLTSAYAHQRALQFAGSDVWVVDFPDESPGDAQVCESVQTRSDSVLASGAVLDDFREEAKLRATRQTLPTISVSPGALAVWWSRPDISGGLSYGRDLGQTYDLTGGVPIEIAGHDTTLGSPLPRQVAPDALQASIVRAIPAQGSTTQCWVRFAPGAQDGAEAVLAAQFSGVRPPLTGPFLAEDELRASPGDLAGGAPWGTLLAGILAGLALTIVSARIDRKNVGIYRITGTTFPEVVLMWLVQVAAAVLLALAVGLSYLLVVVARPGGIPAEGATIWFLAMPAIAVASALLALSPVVYAAASRGSLVDQLGDR